MEDLGRVLKETVPAVLKDRVEQAIQDSVMMAEKGQRYVDHMKARLEFISKDSESGGYKGPTGEGRCLANGGRQQKSLGRKTRWRRPPEQALKA